MIQIINAILITTIILINVFDINAQSEIEDNIFAKEKLSIEPGIGLQNGAIGVRGKYFFHRYFGTSIGFGSVGYGVIWNICLEARSPELISKRISPFANIMYGVNSGAWLTTPNREEIKKLFRGFSTSIGIKLNSISKLNSYLSLGINYRFLSEDLDEYIQAFNQVHGTSKDQNHSKLFPVFGITILLNG